MAQKFMENPQSSPFWPILSIGTDSKTMNYPQSERIIKGPYSLLIKRALPFNRHGWSQFEPPKSLLLQPLGL